MQTRKALRYFCWKRGTKMKNPVGLGRFTKPSYQYVHEKIAEWSPIKKEHPDATIRSVQSGKHVLKIAYWDGTGDSHKHSKLVTVLHPKGENPCSMGKRTNPLKIVQNLPCPICSALNPISRVNFRMQCKQCGTPLLSLKVRRTK